MRNLKKILALVLALVMSLSLMATASATNFKDDADITDTYRVAAEVLDGLKVFRGYENSDGSFTFDPNGEITRAETAAIIYRIVTGDVTDSQVEIYKDYNIFSDVTADKWFAGYVNFCANAEYIKGIGNGKFDPQGKVTGYAALAMILRAIGYTANGGFTGPDWAIQTARTGEARGITRQIKGGTATLGNNATREIVAEILFQAIMANMVDHDILKTLNGQQGYTEINETLGHKMFGLEKISGVVMANEWANLEADTVLADDNTCIVVTEAGVNAGLEADEINKKAVKVGDELTLVDLETPLDAVGETYDIYVADDASSRNVNNKRSLTAAESDLNVVAYNEGKGVNSPNRGDRTYASIAKLAETKDLVTTEDTEWYINYADKWFKDVTSEYRISYAIAKESLKGLDAVTKKTTWKDYIDNLYRLTNSCTIPTPASSAYPGHYLGERTVKIDLDLDGVIETGETIDCWVVAISPNYIINEIDQDIMQRIFYTADRIGNNGTVTEQLQNYAVGEVYVGTTSMKDYSDTMSWVAFQDEYFNAKVNTEKFSVCEIGNSLRIIDNNDDGKAEYVLKIEFNQDKIVGTYKGELLGNHVALADYPEGNLRYCPEELAQDMIVNYSIIDKKLSIWPAAIVTDKIQTKNFQNYTVTTVNSAETYNNSQIDNWTKLDEDIMQMDQNTEYNMYLDTYGNIRSYELAQPHKYALLTEMYPTTDRNGNYIRDFQAIAEVKIAEADVDEYPVNGNATDRNLFFNPTIWTWGVRGWFNVGSTTAPTDAIVSSNLYNANYLQPAVAHLGIGNVNSSTQLVSGAVKTGYTNNTEAYSLSAWGRAVANMQAYTGATQPGTGGVYGVFNYGPESTANKSFSFTNVATYIDNDGTLTLGTASKLSKSTVNGAQLYRVSDKAATTTSTTAATITKLNGHGTEADLIAAYDKWLAAGGAPVKRADDINLTSGRTWFDYYTGSNYQDGTGIYPIYAEDYVHLDLTKSDMGSALSGSTLVVKPGIRHFHIDDNYDTLYNTNSNNYVDATIDTEFYIVLPGSASSIMYKVGYADLPNIRVDEIRAAYAVAHNTSADMDNADYWVADVVVIETTSLAYQYESISLVYGNPYETNGFIRYANTLNNQWKVLQPSYEDQAMMGVVPKDGMNIINWGNSAWLANDGNFGFWKLYDTTWAEPNQLTIGDAQKITDNFNSYGIYAGQVTRIEELVNRTAGSYMDVTTTNTGCVQTHAIDVNYKEANEVPFYRITTLGGTGRYAATKLVLNDIVRAGDIHNGDKLIWVYNQAKTEIAFVVVICEDIDSATGLPVYSTPAWLNRATTGLYDQIIAKAGSIGGDYRVSVYQSYTDANGVAHKELYREVGVNANGQYTVADANTLPLTGYTNRVGTDPITVNGQNITWGSANTITNGVATVNANTTISNALYITGINADLEIVIPYAIKANDVTTNASGAAATKVVASWVSNPATTPATVTSQEVSNTANSGTTALTGVKYGATVTLTVTAANATLNNTNLKVVADGASDDIVATYVGNGAAANEYMYQFAMPDENVQIVVSEILKEYYVAVTPNANITAYSFVGDTVANRNGAAGTTTTTWAANLEVTPVVKTGYEVTAVAAVVTGSNPATSVTCTWNGTKATIASADGATKNVTITFTTAQKAPETSAKVQFVDGFTSTGVTGGTPDQDFGSNVYPALANNSEITLNGATTVRLVVNETNAPVVTVDGTEIPAVVIGAGKWGYLINNVAAGDIIKIAPAKAAAAVGLAVNSATGAITAPTTVSGQSVQYAKMTANPATALAGITVADEATQVNAALTAAEGAAVTLSTIPTLTAADNGKYLVAVVKTDATGKIVSTASVKIQYATPAALKFDTGWVAVGTGVITASNIKIDDVGSSAMTGTPNYIVVPSNPATALANITVMNATADVTAALTAASITPSYAANTTAPTLDSDDNGSYLIVLGVDSGKVVEMGIKAISDITNPA